MASCHRCGAVGVSLQCTFCRKVEYCSKSCQDADWKNGHRHVCIRDYHVIKGYFPVPNRCVEIQIPVLYEKVRGAYSPAKLDALLALLELDGDKELFISKEDGVASLTARGAALWKAIKTMPHSASLAEAATPETRAMLKRECGTLTPPVLTEVPVATTSATGDIELTLEIADAAIKIAVLMQAMYRRGSVVRTELTWLSSREGGECEPHTVLLSVQGPSPEDWIVLDFTLDVKPAWRRFRQYACALANYYTLDATCTGLRVMPCEQKKVDVDILRLVAPEHLPHACVIRVLPPSDKTPALTKFETLPPNVAQTHYEDWVATVDAGQRRIWNDIRLFAMCTAAPTVLRICYGRLLTALPNVEHTHAPQLHGLLSRAAAGRPLRARSAKVPVRCRTSS